MCTLFIQLWINCKWFTCIVISEVFSELIPSTFTFMHLADAFIQTIQVIHFFLSVCVFPGNWTHNLCPAKAMLYHWATGTYKYCDHKTQISKQHRYSNIQFVNPWHCYSCLTVCAYWIQHEEVNSSSGTESHHRGAAVKSVTRTHDLIARL